MQPIEGFSKLSKLSKIDYLANEHFAASPNIKQLLKSYWHHNPEEQKIFDEFSENTITNFYFPYGVVPNFLLNQKNYCVPMVIEESSVVAAASKSAKFWRSRGGFKSRIISTTKVGQVHFMWQGDSLVLRDFFERHKAELMEAIGPYMSNMVSRGGGLTSLELLDKTDLEPHYYQLMARFETCDAMGANFINSILEALGKQFKEMIGQAPEFSGAQRDLQVVMAILSNFTPECLVEASVSCSLEELADPDFNMDPYLFAEKFARAVRIAKIDTHRATTHNKGIFNGIDAVVLATGNDFRAVEACGHTYAARDGQYRGLSDVKIEEGQFHFSLKIPLAIGTVGGLTSLHPLARFSLDMLGQPGAPELMQIIAAMGLAQNFAALRSLVTYGIQKGHMKMHLMNILNHLEASEAEREKARLYFANEIISFKSVRDFIALQRNYQ